MLIKNGGIYRNIESKNFLHYKALGYEAAESEEPTVPKEDPEQSETPDSEKSEKSKGK
jgi:hypothetical protein